METAITVLLYLFVAYFVLGLLFFLVVAAVIYWLYRKAQKLDLEEDEEEEEKAKLWEGKGTLEDPNLTPTNSEKNEGV